MGSWLYPVSGARGFLDANGKRRPTTFDAVREVVDERVFPKRAEWPCVQNGRNVRPGDDLFLYTGGVGIFAAGRVIGAEPAPSGSGWVISWQLDARRTKRLLDAPVAADKVRKHVHPRVTVRDFDKGAKALRRALA